MVYLEIGDRTPDDGVTYPDDDIAVVTWTASGARATKTERPIEARTGNPRSLPHAVHRVDALDGIPYNTLSRRNLSDSQVFN